MANVYMILNLRKLLKVVLYSTSNKLIVHPAALVEEGVDGVPMGGPHGAANGARPPLHTEGSRPGTASGRKGPLTSARLSSGALSQLVLRCLHGPLPRENPRFHHVGDPCANRRNIARRLRF